MAELNYKIAREFVENYRAFNTPIIGGSMSLSYHDNYCAAWLLEQTRKFGFSSTDKMNAACKRYLRTAKAPPKPGKRQKLRVEVVTFMGKNGAFAANETVRFKAEIVGVNGTRQDISDWHTEGSGYGDAKYATQDAARWSALLGCPVTLVDQTKKGKQ